MKGVHCSNLEVPNITRLLACIPTEFDGYVYFILELVVVATRDFGKSFEHPGFSFGEDVSAGVHESAEDVKKRLTGGRLFNKNG